MNYSDEYLERIVEEMKNRIQNKIIDLHERITEHNKDLFDSEFVEYVNELCDMLESYYKLYIYTISI